MRVTQTDDALVQAAHWLRQLHLAVADFRPPVDAVWREGGAWRQGLVVGHNDAAPYNAAWLPTGEATGRLTGFFDWDFAAPVTPVADLAFTAFGWVPLHARHVVAAEGFTAFADRERRLRLFLHARTAGTVSPTRCSGPRRNGSGPAPRGSAEPRPRETRPTAAWSSGGWTATSSGRPWRCPRSWPEPAAPRTRGPARARWRLPATERRPGGKSGQRQWPVPVWETS